jgi:hypothetical protein
MTWKNRRDFLRAAGPIRLYAVIGAVIAVWVLFGLVQTSYELWRLNRSQGWDNVILAIRLVFSVSHGLLAIYLCRLYWKFADVIGATAGGRACRMDEWSWLQLRIAYVLVAIVALGLVSQVWEWVLGQYLLEFLAPTPE